MSALPLGVNVLARVTAGCLRRLLYYRSMALGIGMSTDSPVRLAAISEKSATRARMRQNLPLRQESARRVPAQRSESRLQPTNQEYTVGVQALADDPGTG